MQSIEKAVHETALASARRFSTPGWARGLVAFVIALFVVASASAQLSGRGTIQGTVTDPTGAVIPQANVVITNVATNVKQISKTTASGDYTVSVDPGIFRVTISMDGFKSITQENIHVNALESVAVNLTLETGSASETVTVTDAPPVLETSNATMGSTVEQEMYAALPVLQQGSTRRATDFISLLPGVNAEVSNGNLGTNTGAVNGSGSRGAVSGVYINGVPLMSVAGQGDPRFIYTAMAMDSINQFQVQTAGYPAIYEGQGVINYTVKSGSNKFHGGVYDYFRNTALDTWGFMAPGSAVTDSSGNILKPAQKPIEHQNEYGIFAGLPIIKDKLFYFGLYEGYRYSKGPNWQIETIPTTAMRSGDFTATGFKIYDPDSTKCATSACKAYTRSQFAQNGKTNIIPSSRFSPAAQYLQKFLPTPTNSAVTGNYLSGYNTGNVSWSTNNRIDWSISPSHNISVVAAFGRGATTAPSSPSGTLSSSQNQMLAPYVTSQQFYTKTKVLMFEDTYTFSPTIVNQLKYGFGRYDSTGLNQDISSVYAATAAGISGLPAGQASNSFPKVTFSGNSGVNQWAGYSSNRNVANGYVLIDNLQWNKGKHSFTFGGEIAWMQYNYLVNATGVNPLQLTFNSSETANYKSSSTSTDSSTGNAYAAFLLGAVNQGSFTLSSAPETGARFRPVSPYAQDDWKVNSRLTINLGLRWNYYPSYREAQDRLSWMDPNVTNSLVGVPGALVFAGHGTGRCNCRTNVDDYMKNFGPRVGFAFQSSPQMVWRGSWGVYYTHGNNVGGSMTSRQGSGLMGYSVTPKTTVVAPSAGQTGSSYWHLDQAYPSYVNPPTLDPTLGTYYTTASSAAQQTVSYADPYYGGRAPQYINWSFGFQRQLTNNLTLTMSYIGSEGHFVFANANTGRGKWSNQLNPAYLYLGSQLSNKATDANLASAGVTKPFSTFSSSTGTIAQALKPFPQYSVSDAFGYNIGNTNYNALQIILQQRVSRGLTFMANYTWSRAMDNADTFRSGYDIPATYAMDGKFHRARSLDYGLSLIDQPQKFVLTGVYALPFGKGQIGGNNKIASALAGGWKFSEIFQAYSGGPLTIQAASCNTNPSQQTCYPILNPNFTGKVKPNGDFGHGVTAASIGTTKYINPDAFVQTTDYMFSTLPRTAPLGLRNAGNYNLDISLRRSFSILELAKLNFEANMFNVTNHTRFGYSSGSTVLSWQPSTTSSTFGTVGVVNTSRDIQLAARIEW